MESGWTLDGWRYPVTVGGRQGGVDAEGAGKLVKGGYTSGVEAGAMANERQAPSLRCMAGRGRI